jgi:nucleoside-diphosphate-sugar epimerase
MDTLRGKRVLVTGASGFIGANLTRKLLYNGADIHALIRPNPNLWRIEEIIPRITLHQVDLTDFEMLRETVNQIQPEVIFHLAAGRASTSFQDRLATLQANIFGTFNLLEATTPLNYLRFIHIGSSLEYGTRRRPLKESDRLEPKTFFGVNKAAATLLCQQFAQANQRPIVLLRLFSVYGYWESPTRLIPTAIMAALRNQEIALTPPGYHRDLIFIEDVLDACLRALQAEGVAGEIINVGSGQQWSNEQVVEMVQTISGQKVSVRVGEYPARASDATYWVSDKRKAKRSLGWEPRHTLHEGLKKTIAWFRLHQKAYIDLSI